MHIPMAFFFDKVMFYFPTGKSTTTGESRGNESSYFGVVQILPIILDHLPTKSSLFSLADLSK